MFIPLIFRYIFQKKYRMNKGWWLLIFLALITIPAFSQNENIVRGDLIVMLKKNYSPQELQKNFYRFNGHSTQLQAMRILSKRMNIWLFHFNQDSVNDRQLLSAVRADSLVRDAEFNIKIKPRTTPNDTLFKQQWSLLNTGQAGGLIGADIDATDAWNIAKGDLDAAGDTLIVGIADDGFALSHPDLHFWKNYHEIPDNHIDDDSNGYVDDYSGWNSVGNNGTIGAGDGHGTMVTGIAAARTNNTMGIAGIAWGAEVMPVTPFDAFGDGDVASVVAGYDYFLNQRLNWNKSNGKNGALVVVVNSSFGLNNLDTLANYSLWCNFYDSLGAAGVLSSVATTDDGINVDANLSKGIGDIPSSCSSDYMIASTATDRNDSFDPSSYGWGPVSVDLGAPGVGIISTYLNNSYLTLSGTSFSAPNVSGAIALLYSLPSAALVQQMKNDPTGTALQLKQIILSSVDLLPSLQNKTVTGGRLNVYRALQKETDMFPTGISPVQSQNAFSLQANPNPAQHQFFIMNNTSIHHDGTIRVMNAVGQTIATISFHQNGVNVYSADELGLKNGLYFLLFDDSTDHTVGYGKLMIQY
jgi:serine protease